MTDALAHLSAVLADRYRVERELGAGGMATVYLAEDLRHHRKVALKVLRPELAAVIGAERFLHEISTTANLQHPRCGATTPASGRSLREHIRHGLGRCRLLAAIARGSYLSLNTFPIPEPRSSFAQATLSPHRRSVPPGARAARPGRG